MKPVIFGSALIFLASNHSTAHAADNPMWRFGLSWNCTFQETVTCERQANCRQISAAGTVRIQYRENVILDTQGAPRAIRRHYVQTVSGSPIAAEVKIELETNAVIWLNPVDSSGIFSNNWIGAMIAPKGGVLLAELRPLLCQPAK